MKLKVLYVFGGEQASGAEIVIERLMSYNIQNVEPHLFISPGRFADSLLASAKHYPIQLIPELKKLNRSNSGKIGYYKIALSNYFNISKQVLHYANRHKISIIHANTVVPASYLVPAIIRSKLNSNKKYWIWSDHDIKHYAKLDHYFSSICSNLFNKTLVVSNAVKNKYGAKASVEVLYNGLDPEVFKAENNLREAFRNKYNFSINKKVLGIAGTISPRKGQLELVEAFKEIAKKNADIILVVAGSLGPDDENYNKRFLNSTDHHDRILYLGHYNEMLSFYNGCDIIINNSSSEGSEPLGTTIYEAMACEKIVVASGTGGTSEIINNGTDGFIFNPGDKRSLVKTLENVIGQTFDGKEMSLEARKKAIEKFSIYKMCEQYNGILKEVARIDE